MKGALNEVTFEGFLGADPTEHENRAGTPQCFFDLAQTPLYVADDGEVKQRRPVWIHFVAFGQVATKVLGAFRKGDGMIVHGELNSFYGKGRGRIMQVVVRRAFKIDPAAYSGNEDRDWMVPDEDGSIMPGPGDLG